MTSRSFTAAVVQHACTPDHRENMARSIAGIEAAARQGAQLVLLQELHGSRYFCQSEDEAGFELAEPVPGPTTQQLGELARSLGIVIVASVFERRAAGVYHNTAVVLERDGELAGSYRKMHIPDDPGYHEKYYFAPGDLGFTPIRTSLATLGVLVCWDQWYPEAARLMALAGADLLLYPTAIGWDDRDSPDEQARQLDAWVTVQRGHSIANALPLLAANRCGHEPGPHAGGIRFWGNSLIVGAQGELLAHADESTCILAAELDPGRTEQIRRSWPFLRDRRIDAYGDLLKRFRS